MQDDHRADEMERYRRAAEDALQQHDWAIGYLHGIRRRRGFARGPARPSPRCAGRTGPVLRPGTQG